MTASVATGAPRVLSLGSVRDAQAHLGERVELHGWVVAVRNARQVCFATLGDRSATVQLVCRDGVAAEVADLEPGSAVRVTGTVRETTNERFGPAEVHADVLHVVARAEPSAAAREHRDLELRSPERFLVLAVQSTLTGAVRAFLGTEGYVELHTPKLTAAGSESGAAVFELDFFDERAYLAQSPQFYMQLAMSAGLDRAYEVGPVFRAETGVTNRHAAEFTCIDVELAWIDGAEALMSLEERLLRRALRVVRDLHGDDIRRCFGVEVDVPVEPFPRLTYADACRRLGRVPDESVRLTYRDEQELCRRAGARDGGGFLFVTGYPARDRPFYTMRDGAATRSFDVLWRGIEISSGCQREHRYAQLSDQASAEVAGAAVERYLIGSYLPMFRHGCPPHGGFGIGLERLTMALLGLPSIGDACFAFRGPGRLRP